MTGADYNTKANRGANSNTRRPAAQETGGRRKKRRRGNRALYYILITIILLAAGVTLSLTVFFKIESVTAVGVDKYPPDRVVAASGIVTGENLFRVDSKAASERILKEFPYIDKVDVQLKLPHSVQLEITQCVPSSALADGGEYLLITREGKVLERGLIFIPEHIPLITGVETGGAKPGESLGEEAGEALRALDYLLKAIEETGFGEVTNVNMEDPYNMKIVYENRLLLKLGTEAEVSVKLTFLKEIINNQLPPGAQGVIDASGTDRSHIYTEMPIEDALAGKKRGTKPAISATPGEDEDKPGDEALEAVQNEPNS